MQKRKSGRRKFIIQTFIGGMAAGLGCKYGYATHVLAAQPAAAKPAAVLPVVLSTWSHGIPANQAAMDVLSAGGSVLDAVEQGVRVPEADPTIESVGYGGLPDASGEVTLDACIMDSNGDAGAVAYLKNILHPISVARKVMEKTPHLMLVGDGAYKFAIDQGFEPTNLLTENANQKYEEWQASGSTYAPHANWENHDTIGLLAIDKNGDMAGACTTSGMAFKHSGRVGDSPIIGAGLFVDNEIGGATATGEGEAVMKTLGSFLIVELMRQGYTPQQACEEAVNRIVAKVKLHPHFQIGYIALNKAGQTGAYAYRPGFQYALHQDGSNTLFNTNSLKTTWNEE
ncbi:MAG: N(4)-(beta-N-acetylglucosaminyl)-L-asparaginase [Bacteroidales bacterium]|nr:N(4)-(beta-N-acetylglucosaminyl)-L-asparaginase [Bacteroidales bacterium]